MEFLSNVMPIMISDFYTIVKFYTIRPTIVKNVDIEKIRQKRNSGTE